MQFLNVPSYSETLFHKKTWEIVVLEVNVGHVLKFKTQMEIDYT